MFQASQAASVDTEGKPGPIIPAMSEPGILETLFSTWYFWKAVAILVLVGIASFWYTFKTGRDISELFTDHPRTTEAERPASTGDRQLPPPGAPRP